MKYVSIFILSITLFMGLTFAGKAFFGMDDGMKMGDLECLNHCIDATIIPVVGTSALPVLLFVLIVVAFVRSCWGGSRPSRTEARMIAYLHRLTEPIRLFLLTKKLSPVIIRD